MQTVSDGLCLPEIRGGEAVKQTVFLKPQDITLLKIINKVTDYVKNLLFVEISCKQE